MTTIDLTPAVSGERRETRHRAGLVSYYVAGDGPPLLLIHSINAAASAYEMGPIHERMKATRRVYTLDLPGYGFSERSERPYDIRLLTNAVLDMLDVIREAHGSAPVGALALSLSAEFLARAATEAPDGFATLAFVTPTGFAKGAQRKRAAPETSMEVPGMRRFFGTPLGKPLFRLLTTRASLRYFLERTFGGKTVPDAFVSYDYHTAHQPGAEHAPFAFLSGQLFSRDVRNLFEGLNMPVYVLHGTKGDFRDFSESGWAIARKNWLFSAFDTGALVHFEKPDEFVGAYQRFLSENAGIRTAAS